LQDPAKLKWKKHVKPGTPLPTAWPKKDYESHSRDYQAMRAKLRKDNRPESDMSKLFHDDLAWTNLLFSKSPNASVVGAFEGANYEATGYYRPQMQCLMFDRSEAFCAVCAEAVSETIDLYSR